MNKVIEYVLVAIRKHHGATDMADISSQECYNGWLYEKKILIFSVEIVIIRHDQNEVQ
jgi:hypothetical protein